MCESGGSDDSFSSTDGEEQELWEQTQIEKGVKRRPGEQVGRSTKHCDPLIFYIFECFCCEISSFFLVLDFTFYELIIIIISFSERPLSVQLLCVCVLVFVNF